VILSPKLFIDTCVAKPLSNRILNHYKSVYPSIQITHLTDFYRQSRSDSVWLPNLADEGGWIAVSADLGRDKKKPSLPQLCRDYGVTSVLMTDTLHKKGVNMHQEVLHEILRNIEPIYKAPAGTVISIGQTQEKGGIVKFALRINRPGKPQISLATLLENPS